MQKSIADGIETVTGGEGPSLVIVHGAGANAEAFQGFAGLVGEGFAVTMPNLAGYGKTSRDPALPALENHVAVLIRVLKREKRPIFLIGHSMGGLVALKAAAAMPEAIARLVLVEPMAFGVLDPSDPLDAEALREDRAAVDELARQVDAGNPEAGAAAFISYWNGTPWPKLPEHVRQRLTAMAPQLRAETPMVSYDPTAARSYAPLGEKTLMMVGERSPMPAKRIVERLSEAMPGAAVESVARASHMSVVMQPDLFAPAIVAFLRQG